MKSSSTKLNSYKVCWAEASSSPVDSFPLGEGEFGANVWLDQDGAAHVVFSAVSAVDERFKAIKLGELRIHSPSGSKITPCRQVLDMRRGIAKLRVGSLVVTIVFIRHQKRAVIKVDNRGKEPARVSIHLWRHCEALPQAGPEHPGDYFDAKEEGFVLFHWNGSHDQLSSKMATHVPSPEQFAFLNVFQNRTSGVLVRSSLLKTEANLLEGWSISPGKCFLEVDYYSTQEGIPGFQKHLWENARKSVGLQDHLFWWDSFWQRSWVRLSGFPEAAQINLAYLAQRYINACAGAGPFPIAFNGSIFNVAIPAFGHSYLKGINPEERNADDRDWGNLHIMGQNTRHVYWPMIEAGDFDLMQPMFESIRRSFAFHRKRTRFVYGKGGMVFPEAQFFGGIPVFDGEGLRHLSHHFTATLEFLWMAIKTYETTGNHCFYQRLLLPFLRDILIFFREHLRPSTDGEFELAVSGVLESYVGARNGAPDLAGLHAVATWVQTHIEESGLQNLSTEILKNLPQLPLCTVDHEILFAPHGIGMLAHLENPWELPELYSVFPFEVIQARSSPDSIQTAQRTLKHSLQPDFRLKGITHKETGGWVPTALHLALLGDAAGASRLLVRNVQDKDEEFSQLDLKQEQNFVAIRSKFPAFWRHHFDWLPDQCHGGIILKTLHLMLLQSDAQGVHVFPSWPPDWNVTFRLHGPDGRIVEGSYTNGLPATVQMTAPTTSLPKHNAELTSNAATDAESHC